LVGVPHEAPEHAAPDKLQITPLFWESLSTEAVKTVEEDIWTEADAGFTETEMGGAATKVMAAEADLVTSATDVACSEIVAGLGTAVGAV